MFVTIDDYYNVQFYNETKQALNNNNIPFKEYISTKPPYHFYIEVDDKHKPNFINFDEPPKTYSRFLVNITKALNPRDDYIYERRETYVNEKAIAHYAINDALSAGQKTNQGVLFHSTKENILRVSKLFPRKIFFMGVYFNQRYKIFFSDSLLIKNFIQEHDILAQGKDFKGNAGVLDLETYLNFNVFQEKDRLQKIASTPYVLKGQYYINSSIRPEISSMFVLS